MIQEIAAAVIWCLALCLLPDLKRRKDKSILAAALTIATALTLNVDSIYIAGDHVLGNRNLLDLIANIFMVVGIYFLSCAILRAADVSETVDIHGRAGLTVLGIVVVALIVSFSLVDAPRTSTAFMRDFGSQWPAAVYSSVQFLYIGVVVAITGLTCFRFRGEMARPYFRIAFEFIGLGCALAVVLVLAVLGMDVLHLMGDLEAMTRLSYVYDVALMGAMVLLCVGLALPPVARRLERRSDARAAAVLVERLSGVWDRLTSERSEIRLDLPPTATGRHDAPKRRLHRMLVEIQDALFVDPHLAQLLSENDLDVLRETEQHLGTRLAASRVRPLRLSRKGTQLRDRQRR
jgi:heme/copper-type cytochrome/quinol oxidase subunit 2